MKKRRMLLFLWMACLITAVAGGGTSVQAIVEEPGGIPNYFGTTPNWAYSPQMTKFVDPLPMLWDPRNPVPAEAPAKCMTVAVPDTRTFPGSDYYEIELQQFTEKMHSQLPATTLRGYVQVNYGTNAGGTANTVAPAPIRYLGPLIIAQKDRPVRIKFTNKLPFGPSVNGHRPGDLFVPADVTLMGAGPGPSAPRTQADDVICRTDPTKCYTQNRAVLHLHGGRNPWISDGTAHQWITPAGETTLNASYAKGASTQNVPDMWFNPTTHVIVPAGTPGATNDPGPGSSTYYYTNQQSSRMMFYHDHAYGITRLNVYVGMAAGYLVQDAMELALINGGTVGGRTYEPGTIPAEQIPLVIQDKSFVNAADNDTLAGDKIFETDPTWNWGTGARNGQGKITEAKTGDLWWPHVYVPAQNPYNPDFTGVNPMGRWVYGPWFWPPTNNIPYPPIANPYFYDDPLCVAGDIACSSPSPEMPASPNPSWGAEAFMDTPVINGQAYPTITLEPKAYRFRILNAAHDRFFNLQFYVAADANTHIAGDPTLAAPVMCDGTENPAATNCSEVKMVPAAPTASFPATWPTDGREGGVPDPAYVGPEFIQIGTEGGFLPQPVVLPNQPINWITDPTLFRAGLVAQQNEGGGTLQLGPAERADVIVDFSAFSGKTLILYNDAPAPWPALDPHYDYYTGAPDRRAEMGGADEVLPGKGPNVRTLMQIKVAGDVAPFNLDRLNAAFAPAAGKLGVFPASQDPIVAGQTAYNTTYNTTFPALYPNWGMSRIFDSALSFQQVDGTTVSNLPMKPKAIQDEMGEVFDDYGRMSAKLGLELPFTTALNQTFVVQNFVDPTTEIVQNDGIQIWKITHNGVDTHPVHFHLFDVQVLNRVSWDGFMHLVDPNELGWKDTVKINPLQDTVVALRPVVPRVPFIQPNNMRYLNPAMPPNAADGFTNLNPLTAELINPPVTNVMTNFGHEYAWHCHILSHEENDMMRPLVLNPNAQSEILWRNGSNGLNVLWYMNGATKAGQAQLPKNTDLNWKVVGGADFNSDGKTDVLWRNTSTGQNMVWYMNGINRTGQASIDRISDLNYKIVGTGDFNGDGKPDILWRNTSTGINIVWYMNGVTKTGQATLDKVSDLNYAIVGTGDFNNDGKPDILWRHSVSGLNLVWYMNGVTKTAQARILTEANSNWKIVDVGDFNSDINPDLVWRNTSTGQNLVWYMNGITKTGQATLDSVSDLNYSIVPR
jgi:FtsP/CotA-like multicopper oxidase with cupredoxin domain